MDNQNFEEINTKEKDRFSLKDLVDLVELFVLAIMAILIVFTVFCRISFVQGSSMEKTLLENNMRSLSDPGAAERLLAGRAGRA